MSANVGDNWFHQLFNLFHNFGKVFVQFYVGSKQFPTYLSILPLIFSSCPTYFMIVPLFSFNFHPISVKMYVCMYVCMHICKCRMSRNKYMYIHTWLPCPSLYAILYVYPYIYIYIKKGQKNMFPFLKIFYPKNI